MNTPGAKVPIRIETSGEFDLLDDLQKRIDALRQGNRELAEETGELGKNMEDLGESSTTASSQMDTLAKLGKAGAIHILGQSIQVVAQGIRGLSKDFEGVNDSASAALEMAANGAEALGNATSAAAQGWAVAGPLGAAIGASASLIVSVVRPAYQGMVEDLKNSKEAQDRAEESVRKLAEARREFAEQTRRENMAAFFQTELNLIEAQVKAMERRARVAAAVRDAETAEARAGVGDATGAQAARMGIAIDFQSRSDSIRAAIEKAENLAAAAEERASVLRLKTAELAESQGEMTDVTVRAREQAAAAEKAAAEARADAEAAAEIGAAQMRELFANFTSRFSEAADTAAQEAAGAASEVIAAVEKSGTQLSAFQQQAMANLRAIVADGQVAQDETRTLNEALQAIISGWQGDTKTLITIMAAGNDITRNLATELSTLRAEQERLRAQVNQLQAR
jgi:hypothetical protein